MERLSKINELREMAIKYQLDNHKILEKYSLQELQHIYNGIGPAGFPLWLLETITALNASLEVVALIHDVEYYESDFTPEKFAQSNDRFYQNGKAIAKAIYAWYNPRRYYVIKHAKSFSSMCNIFGWSAWTKNQKLD